MNNRLVGRFKIRGGEKCREAVVDNQEGKEGGLDQLGEKRREVEGLEGRRKRTDRPGDGLKELWQQREESRHPPPTQVCGLGVGGRSAPPELRDAKEQEKFGKQE